MNTIGLLPLNIQGHLLLHMNRLLGRLNNKVNQHHFHQPLTR